MQFQSSASDRQPGCSRFHNSVLHGELSREGSIMTDVLLFFVVAMLFSGIMLAAASVLAH